ncbi:hypothetical protein FBU30_007733 [Linnemannia zychae]|nr:hypothetical protein FBU30_007733 [Linnemannia zychae]
MNPTVILSTAIAVVTVAYAFKPKKKTELEAKSIPVPVPKYYLPWQLDGVISYLYKTLRGEDELEFLLEDIKKYGHVVNFKGLDNDFITVADPASIQHILAKKQPNYEKGPGFQEIFHEFLGNGIFNSDGEAWKSQRQIARPHFQTSEFKDAALINKHIDRLLAIIDKHIAAKPNTPIDVQNLFCRFTLDEASDFLFGATVNSLENEQTEFTTAFNYAQTLVAWRFRVPVWKFILPRRRLLNEIKKLDNFVYKIIEDAKAQMATRDHDRKDKENEEDRRDTLLDHFLSQQNSEGFDNKYLRDLLLNFLLAGRDTTASLLSWTMWKLVNHPKVVDRLNEEILQVIGPNRVPSYEDTKKLKYQKQVINEVLRLCPPVPFNTRESVEEDVLPNGCYIPPRTTVAYSAYATHRLPEYWGEDALEFDPDRWGPERVGKIRPFMFVPFHAGPRICLGQNLATTTAQLALTRILQRYDIRASPGFEAKQFGDIVMFSRNGVEIIISHKKAPSEF